MSNRNTFSYEAQAKIIGMHISRVYWAERAGVLTPRWCPDLI